MFVPICCLVFISANRGRRIRVGLFGTPIFTRIGKMRWKTSKEKCQPHARPAPLLLRQPPPAPSPPRTTPHTSRTTIHTSHLPAYRRRFTWRPSKMKSAVYGKRARICALAFAPWNGITRTSFSSLLASSGAWPSRIASCRTLSATS